MAKAPQTPRAALERLHEACTESLAKSFDEGREAQLARQFVFGAELEPWLSALAGRPERALYEIAHREYFIAMLNLVQGQYRNAFKGLRLVLELNLQGILLSTDPIGLSEWLRNAKDTSWAAIVDEEKGVFSPRFSKAFFPALEEKMGAYRGVAKTIYKELSETTHGNVSNAIQLPDSIAFSDDAFATWCEKAETVRSTVHFGLALRYLGELDGERTRLVEAMLLDRLGNIAAVRERLGGPA
jgi:hypothetical protein